jgi:hypothetical protein
MMAADTPVDSADARESREEFPETLSVRCRAARPNGAPEDAWTEPNVLRARAHLLSLGVSERRVDKVILALAADSAVISPRAANNPTAVRRARARAAGKHRGRQLPPWCGECPPEGRLDASRRWREDDDGLPYKCPDCHPALIGET